MISRHISTPIDKKQGQLLVLAAFFLGIYTVTLTLAPAARARSWQVNYHWANIAAYAVWLALFYLAHRGTKHWLPSRDPYLLPVAGLLSGWGLLSIWRLYTPFGLRQTAWLAVSVVVLYAGLRLPSDLVFLRKYKYLWLTAGLVLTGLTLVFGTNPSGAAAPRLWLGWGGFYFQPSEPLKFLLIVYLAAYLAEINIGRDLELVKLPRAWYRMLAPTLIMIGLALALLLVQRDLGTATIFLFLYALMVFIASGQKRVLAVGGVAVLVAGIVGYRLFDVVRLRLDAWINPWIDPSGRSFQIVQSMLAVANGGLLGRGPGLGNPGLVPIPHSDFIFAAIAEEFGLFGALGLLSLIALLVNRGLRIAMRAPEAYARYLATGLTAYLAGQSILIIGGNLRLLPLTGVTLPFVSYGGTSLLTTFVALLLLLHISSLVGDQPAKDAELRPVAQIGGVLLAGLGAAALATGWWSIFRGPTLLTRTDNPRRAIADRFVRRGLILDHDNQPLAISEGSPGEYTRHYSYSPLSPVLGYDNPTYGQSGIEQSQDEYLRGVLGYPGLVAWWNHLLYGQPPPGLDIRLSLDLTLQEATDQAMGEHHGAAVLLNAHSGEILALASHPGFDANQLEIEWNRLIQSGDAPLLDRPILGRYGSGAMFSDLFPANKEIPDVDSTIQLRSPTGPRLDITQHSPLVSPLQIAVVAAALTNHGECPPLSMVTAVNMPEAGWTLLPPLGKPVRVLAQGAADSLQKNQAVAELSTWQHVETIPSGPTWFIGGTLQDWKGTPYAVVILLEEDNPATAAVIGQAVLKAAMHP